MGWHMEWRRREILNWTSETIQRSIQADSTRSRSANRNNTPREWRGCCRWSTLEPFGRRTFGPNIESRRAHWMLWAPVRVNFAMWNDMSVVLIGKVERTTVASRIQTYRSRNQHEERCHNNTPWLRGWFGIISEPQILHVIRLIMIHRLWLSRWLISPYVSSAMHAASENIKKSKNKFTSNWPNQTHRARHVALTRKQLVSHCNRTKVIDK